MIWNLSLQDTIVAVEALTEYSSRDPNKDLYNIRVRIEVTSTPHWQKIISLNKENWNKMQRIEVSCTFITCSKLLILLTTNI